MRPKLFSTLAANQFQFLISFGDHKDSDIARLLGQTSGSTFPSWTGPQLKNHPVLSPPTELLARFEALVKPMSAAVLGCSRKIQNLRRTRDLLLPRLLSGQVKVGTKKK
jgi:type I restriction enzyme S subunit